MIHLLIPPTAATPHFEFIQKFKQALETENTLGGVGAKKKSIFFGGPITGCKRCLTAGTH
jgi:hypothetical protein